MFNYTSLALPCFKGLKQYKIAKVCTVNYWPHAAGSHTYGEDPTCGGSTANFGRDKLKSYLSCPVVSCLVYISAFHHSVSAMSLPTRGDLHCSTQRGNKDIAQTRRIPRDTVSNSTHAGSVERNSKKKTVFLFCS